MKVFLNAYLDKNFGDDLFVDLILNRYKDIEFSTISYQKPYLSYNNLREIYFSTFTRGINKLLKVLSNNSKDLYSIIANKNDIAVTIGGSMFMESSNSYKVLYYNNFKIPYYIVGVNVGPYKTKNYLEFLKENIFKNAQDICFRDEKSYSLFKELNNIRYAPDLLFSLNLDDYKIVAPSQKKAIISVIDINKKASQIENADPELYENLILNLISFFKNNNYIVELISFCEDEGDVEAINRIISKSNDDILTFFYSNNISETITELSTATTIVGTRFHANVLGFLLNKNVIPIIYNDKTKNMLNDIRYEGVYFDINDKSKMHIDNLKLNDLEYTLDVKEYVIKASNHFAELDGVMKSGKQNERK